MSADNGIYIHKFPEGYRVEELMAVENIWEWDRENDTWNPNLPQEKVDSNFIDFFKNSPVFESLEKAQEYARTLAEYCYILEYGVCLI
jgi:hypothetical protein